MIVFQSASHSHHWCNFILRALLIPHSSFLLHPSPPYSLSPCFPILASERKCKVGPREVSLSSFNSYIFYFETQQVIRGCPPKLDIESEAT
jgi:hypothetical protein